MDYRNVCGMVCSNHKLRKLDEAKVKSIVKLWENVRLLESVKAKYPKPFLVQNYN